MFPKEGILLRWLLFFTGVGIKLFLQGKTFFGKNLCLGNEARVGELTWTDGSKWSVGALDA